LEDERTSVARWKSRAAESTCPKGTRAEEDVPERRSVISGWLAVVRRGFIEIGIV